MVINHPQTCDLAGGLGVTVQLEHVTVKNQTGKLFQIEADAAGGDIEGTIQFYKAIDPPNHSDLFCKKPDGSDGHVKWIRNGLNFIYKVPSNSKSEITIDVTRS